MTAAAAASLRLHRQVFSRLLSSPPALRAEVARFALAPRFCSTASTSPGPTVSRPLSIYITSAAAAKGRGRRFASTATESATTDHPSNTAPPPPTRSLPSRILTRTALVLLCLSAGFAMSAAPAAETVNGYLNPPSDADTLALYTPPTPRAEEINTHILSHPLAVQLRARPDLVEGRPHMKIPPAMRPHNLTGGTLLGEGRIAVPPLNFASAPDADGLPTLTQIAYLGDSLCGHPGIVHGGLLATLLDEGLARACFPALPNKVGVTASLKIDYRVPCPADSYVVLRARTTKVEGRKAWVEGWIELLGEDGAEGQRLVEAEALFIEPKGAKSMARVYSSQ